MTQSELKRKLYELAAIYFEPLTDRGNIVWGRTKPVNPGSPMVALTTGPINRAQRPIRMYRDGIVQDCWPSETMLQVDLFTKGAPVTDDPNVTAARENTAVCDLTDFVNFIHSAYVDNWCYINDISLNVSNIHDLTALTNDTSWTYRAMAEITVGFVQTAVEHAANPITGSLPTHSGGRSQQLADKKTGWFEQVEVEYDKEIRDNGK